MLLEFVCFFFLREREKERERERERENVLSSSVYLFKERVIVGLT